MEVMYYIHDSIIAIGKLGNLVPPCPSNTLNASARRFARKEDFPQVEEVLYEKKLFDLFFSLSSVLKPKALLRVFSGNLLLLTNGQRADPPF